MSYTLAMTAAIPNVERQTDSCPPTAVDPLARTATAIIMGATSTTEASLYQSAPGSEIDPLAETATAIVQGATSTAGAPMTATVAALLGLPTPTPLGSAAQTATAAVACAAFQRATIQAQILLTGTARAISYTWSPTPTFTPGPFSAEEFAIRRTEFINTLVSATGFQHPIFGDIADQILSEESAYNLRLPSFEVNVAKTWFAGSEYVALVAPGASMVALGSIDGRKRFFLFRVTDGTPVLMGGPAESLSTDAAEVVGFGAGIGSFDPPPYTSNLFQTIVSVSGFSDVNNNGLPDLAVGQWGGGKCCPPYMTLLELTPDGDVRNITPQSREVFITGFADLNNDGVWEIKSWSYIIVPLQWAACCLPTFVRWYGWNGAAYVDISAQHPELYMPEIEANLRTIDPQRVHSKLGAKEW